MTKRAVDLPPVAGRLEITSLEDYVDRAMEHIGKGTVDLGSERVRARIRDWLLQEMSGYLNVLAWDLSKGADRGIRQVLQIARDPDYYAKASERRKRRRQEFLRDCTSSPPAQPAQELMPMGIELPQANFGIYYVDSLEEPAFQIRLIGSTNTQQQAEAEVARLFGPRSTGPRINGTGSDIVRLVGMTPTGEPVIMKSWRVG